MLAAHQKSIEQMQETLRQKLLSDESWREKVTLALISACLVCFRNTLSFCQKLVQKDFIATLNTYGSIWNFSFQIYLRYMHFPKY